MLAHADFAPWYLFGAILLAGFNLPVSIDILLVAAALLAATALPEKMWHLFAAVSIGCYLSAWISYWVGRLLVGRGLLRLKFFSKLLSQERIERVKTFYDKYGLLTLVIGRFIPFGMRNCIFMTTGISRFSFVKFILRDALACLIWSTTAFFLFYFAGQNFETLYPYLKLFNLIIFSLFAIAVIGFVWYKMRKSARSKSSCS
ncbi:MAG: hypothetical protein A2Y28_03305 [Chlamydiae bacterium GWC2_50_10]|nr:MAG: hypothetical protein A2Z85_01740 [Chlamydiae bacterium GWA2_50_15]OGN54290.1 MAG: hypothetical protein A2Y28_03305 [Chlamydiae bacterium GWC2_50_10]OGN55524.1 MAG: hypothetical protein A2098_01085 [Chlamydiae bacterium GWF2_49_8]OGN58867.1 MAG: hypothetical protein A3D18_03590 [Chlamydiae bacterium RIFCSPHIGHO2_02_FULL_49_29]OGN62562.1 MAG: hypothetical protein A3E26_01325 [Chlamydiae bacterium RIFCSPHIGHO2_12_FULL_49_32]OGN68431.1 MAG: hypothetical protein A3I15_04530 [Chlamydiae bact